MYGGVYRVDLPPVQAVPHIAQLPGVSVDNPPPMSIARLMAQSWQPSANPLQYALGIAPLVSVSTVGPSGFWITQTRRRRG